MKDDCCLSCKKQKEAKKASKEKKHANNRDDALKPVSSLYRSRRCVDSNAKGCPLWAKEGFCKKSEFRNYMKTNCCKSCGGRTSQLYMAKRLKRSPSETVKMIETEMKRRRKK